MTDSYHPAAPTSGPGPGGGPSLPQSFLWWQCQLRQYSVRHHGGRPSAGMRPWVMLSEGSYRATVLIVKREPEEHIQQFRFLAKRTHDPAERYASALRVLSADYYQQPETFSDRVSALFSQATPWLDDLLEAGDCVLRYEQYRQRYVIPCTVRVVPPEDPVHQATYWHNCLFNADIPGNIRVLEFEPVWADAEGSGVTAREI